MGRTGLIELPATPPGHMERPDFTRLLLGPACPFASGIYLMNGRQKLTWSLPLDPGERKALTYTYEV